MKMSDMNPSDLSTHYFIVNYLVEAGWEPQRDQLAFENGAWTIYDIDMQRFNGRMRLRIFRDPTIDELGLALSTPQGQTIGLYLKYGVCLPEVLNTIVEIQDVIDAHTYQQYIARLVHICPEVFVGTDDTPRIRLIDTKGLDAKIP